MGLDNVDGPIMTTDGEEVIDESDEIERVRG